MVSALDLVDDCIADIQARLNLNPSATKTISTAASTKQPKKEKKAVKKDSNSNTNNDQTNGEQPDICKLEFKVGVVTKVWNHETADKLYCEEIDVGEAEPRQIASGLRPHFTLEQMHGQRLLVVVSTMCIVFYKWHFCARFAQHLSVLDTIIIQSNLKAKKLVGFKSHGMVLCAAQKKEGSDEELVEFIEPPNDAKIGEVVTFEGLPKPEPLSATQVDKKKVFEVCSKGMKTNEDRVATWNGHVFMTSAGPCKAKTVAGGVMR
jgi:aminoacyl tRNA synthase complex-interacting multifunctional protein 1